MADNERKIPDSLHVSLVNFKQSFDLRSIEIWKDKGEWLTELSLLNSRKGNDNKKDHLEMHVFKMYIKSIFRRLDNEEVKKAIMLHEKADGSVLRTPFHIVYTFKDGTIVKRRWPREN